jgi:tetratricopeptide (TPR) repeat protein
VKRPAPYLVLLLLAVLTFSLAPVMQSRVSAWTKQDEAPSVLKLVLGDARSAFASHFFVKADIYFHSGYYPSIFDRSKAPKDSRHMTSEEGSPAEEEHERQMSFLDEPKDWIERFGRQFMVTQHTHLEHGNEREILPWLRISAELDPHRVETYTVAAYWLRCHLGKPAEAEQFLREGLRNNPNSYEIMFELGRLYHENLKDPAHARNIWELALRRWSEQESGKKAPALLAREEIAVNLARVEEAQGDYRSAIAHLELAMKASPAPEALRKQIDELKQKLAAGSPPSK